MNTSQFSRDSYEVKFTENINRTMQLPEKIIASSSMNNSALNRPQVEMLQRPQEQSLNDVSEEEDEVTNLDDGSDAEERQRETRAMASPGYSPNIINKPYIPESVRQRPVAQHRSPVVARDVSERLDRLEAELQLVRQVGIYAGGVMAVYIALKMAGFLFFRR